MASRKPPLPTRPRNYKFVLTPLADAMFQLLIFFMLSSSLTPYSLITLKSGSEKAPEESAGQNDGPGNDPERPAPPANTDIVLWNVGNGLVRVGGQDYAIEQLGDLADAIGSQDNPGRVVLIVQDDARVQDVAGALEALDGANVGAVQITREGA
jgi:biopolymer transport protein ExbD